MNRYTAGARGGRGLGRTALALGAVVIALSIGAVCGQPPTAAPDADALYAHIKKAQKAAGGDLVRFFYRRCLSPAFDPAITRGAQVPAPVPPFKVMDQLYFLGHNEVSAWALDTSEGFIIFDTLNSPGEAKTYIEGGMRKLGLDPARIKYVVVTHEHGDHYGGSTYLSERFGAKIMASTIAWEAMARGRSRPSRPAGAGAAREGPPVDWAKLVPARGLDITDGQKFEVGDTTLAFYYTPGHAAGGVSTIFKTTDRGVPHVVGLHGGLGAINNPADRVTHIAALKRWRALAQAAGVDTLIANHQVQDGAVENLELLKIRRAGDPNPFVLGKSGYLRYIDVNIECTYANMARHGEKIE